MEQKRFTKEQLRTLYDAEIHFDSVVHHNIIRNAPRWLTEQIVNIYEATTHSSLQHNYSCTVCVMNIYNTIGKKYYDDKKYYEELDKKNNTESKKNIKKSVKNNGKTKD